MNEKRIIKNFQLFELIATVISMVLMLILLIAPCIKVDYKNYNEKVLEIQVQISQSGDETYQKYEENISKQSESRISLGQAMMEIITDEAGNEPDKDINIGYFKFGMYILKYTSFGGAERLILFNGFIMSIAMLLIGALFAVCFFALLIHMIIKIVYFVKGSTKSNNRFVDKSIRNYSGLLFFYAIFLIIINIFRIPAVFAAYPINGAFMLLFEFSPLIYAVVAIEAVLFVIHLIFKSKANYVYGFRN